MRFRFVATAYAVWIFAIFGVFYLAEGKNENALQLTVMAGVIPAVCQILLLGLDWRGLVAPMKIWAAFLLVMLIGYIVTAMDPETAPRSGQGLIIPAAWTPFVYLLNAVFVMTIGALIAGCPDRRLLRSIAGIYCILCGLFLVYVDATGAWVWGRLRANDIESNVWGLVGLTVCLGALARKPGPIAIAAFLPGLTTIVFASSREHMLALAAALLVIMILYMRETNRHRVVVMLSASCVVLVATVLLLDPYILEAIHYLGSDVLLLDSVNRGIDSGFTGRTEIWAGATDLWLQHPLLGVGYRQHEQFVLGGAPAHNAYLAMLADMGLLGLVVYLVLLAASLVAARDIQDPRTRRFVVAAIVGYIVAGFFDRRTINAGNPYGIFFVVACSVALVQHSLYSVGVLRPTPLVLAQEASPN